MVKLKNYSFSKFVKVELGKIQENMLQLDISQVQSTGDTFFSATDTAYLIFMLIGIIGYITVPSVANYIVHAGGGNALLSKVNNLFARTSQSTIGVGKAGMGMVGDSMGNQRQKVSESMSSSGNNSSYFDDDKSSFQKDKLSGK